MRGEMLWFNEAKGVGLIEAESGERLAVERDSFLDGTAPVGRCRGLAVEFVPGESADGPIATAVTVIVPADQRRTTRHRGARMV